MDSNNEYISDIDAQEENDEVSNSLTRRKATNESTEKSNAEKTQVNITKPVKKSSYVQEYFQIKDGHVVCKIILLLKSKEVECQKSYKYDGGTGNMKQHLQLKHGILSPDDFQLNKKY